MFLVQNCQTPHNIMRDLHRYCSNRESKKEILQIPMKVKPLLPIDEQFKDSEQQEPLSREEVDAKWASKNIEPITFHIKRAQLNWSSKKEKEAPIDLLDAALKKTST